MAPKKLNLNSYYGFSKVPFTKYMWATKMFEAQSQKELIDGLSLWIQTKGIALVYGAAGVGKSISLRRFIKELDERRYQVFYLFNMRLTPLGFLRSLTRALGLPVLYHQADLFDALSAHLGTFEQRLNKHPLIIFDDADSLRDELLELMRLLANFEMDSVDRCSFIISGSGRLAARMRRTANEALRQRISFSHQLRGDEAVQLIFHYSKGLPRVINQIAMQALIRGATKSQNVIDADFLKHQVFSHSLFDQRLDEQPD